MSSLDIIPCTIITGPTATGKTAMAVQLAKQINGEIVSADSRQVYRKMDLGTGKDLPEYGEIPYHLIDVVDPKEIYHLSAFLKDANHAIREIHSRGKKVIICGGTPMWIHALLCRYEMPGNDPDYTQREQRCQQSLSDLCKEYRARFPESAAQFKDWENINRVVRALEIAEAKAAGADTASVQLPTLDAQIIAPYYPRSVVRERVEIRLDARLNAGMVQEVEQLIHAGVTHEKLDFFGLEYRYISRYLRGELSYDEMRILLLNKIRQFVKRQDIWFRKFEREGFPIQWLPNGDLSLLK